MKRLLLLITLPVAICSAARLNAQNMEYKKPTDVALTNPDLIEVFDNFAFDDVMNHGTLDMKTRALNALACLNEVLPEK